MPADLRREHKTLIFHQGSCLLELTNQVMTKMMAYSTMCSLQSSWSQSISCTNHQITNIK